MDELKLIIEGLLSNKEIDDFEDSLLFREQVQNDPEAVRILLDLLRNSTGKSQERAAQMLVSFTPDTLPEITKGLTSGDAAWRHRLIELIWTMVNIVDESQWQSLFKSIQNSLFSLFNVTDQIEQNFENPIEIEHTIRVCDDAYLLCKGLLDPDFIPGDFLELEDEERNMEIRVFRSRADSDLLVS